MYVTCECGIKRNTEEAEKCPVCEVRDYWKDIKNDPLMQPFKKPKTKMREYWVKKQREHRRKILLNK